MNHCHEDYWACNVLVVFYDTHEGTDIKEARFIARRPIYPGEEILWRYANMKELEYLALQDEQLLFKEMEVSTNPNPRPIPNPDPTYAYT